MWCLLIQAKEEGEDSPWQLLEVVNGRCGRRRGWRSTIGRRKNHCKKKLLIIRENPEAANKLRENPEAAIKKNGCKILNFSRENPEAANKKNSCKIWRENPEAAIKKNSPTRKIL